jgi:hypothetical protein
MQLRRRVLLKMIESRHMPIGKELEANLGNAVGLYDYWIVRNERSGNETNIAEKIVLEYAHFPHTLPQAVVLLEPERGLRPFINSHCPPLPPIFPPLIRGDSRRSLRSPSQSGYRWCRRFQGQLYQ